jgi:hypothetical protein
MTRRLPGWRWLQPFDRLRARTKAAPRPRWTPRPEAIMLLPLAARLEPPPFTDRLRPEAACCWRVTLRTLLRKLLAWPAFGVSERTRPGFGRKRLSSLLMAADPPETAALGAECRENRGKC